MTTAPSTPNAGTPPVTEGAGVPIADLRAGGEAAEVQPTPALEEQQATATEGVPAAPSGGAVLDTTVDERAFDKAKRLDMTLENETNAIKIGEEHRLKFAREVLIGLGFLVFLIVCGYGSGWGNKDAWQAMFEIVKIGALPLVTLIIGFYFPSSNK